MDFSFRAVREHTIAAALSISRSLLSRPKRVAELAEKYDVPMAYISLAWLLQKDAVVSPVIGATKISHLEDAVKAVSLTLSPEDVAYLEEPYVPHSIVGAIPQG